MAIPRPRTVSRLSLIHIFADELKGRWARDSKYGVQFEVEGYEEIITPTKEGIIGYLSSGQVKGIGPKTAEKIFQAFGMDTLRILDEEPERLLSIPGLPGRTPGSFSAVPH